MPCQCIPPLTRRNGIKSNQKGLCGDAMMRCNRCYVINPGYVNMCTKIKWLFYGLPFGTYNTHRTSSGDMVKWYVSLTFPTYNTLARSTTRNHKMYFDRAVPTLMHCLSHHSDPPGRVCYDHWSDIIGDCISSGTSVIWQQWLFAGDTVWLH